MKKSEKQKLRQLKYQDLIKLLSQKTNDLIKLETICYRNNGTSTLVRNYPSKKPPEGTIKKFGNIRNLKKEIAIIHTILHQKGGYKWNLNPKQLKSN